MNVMFHAQNRGSQIQFEPPLSSNLILWINGDNVVNVGSGISEFINISTSPDKSANPSFVADADGDEAVLQTSGSIYESYNNNKCAIFGTYNPYSYEWTRSRYVFSMDNWGNGFTVFIVCKDDGRTIDETLQGVILDNDGSGDGNSTYFQSKWTFGTSYGWGLFQNSGGDTIANSGVIMDEIAVYTFEEGNLRRNGIEEPCVYKQSQNYFSFHYLCKNFIGTIAEVMIYNTNLGVSDREAVELYLKTKYAL